MRCIVGHPPSSTCIREPVHCSSALIFPYSIAALSSKNSTDTCRLKSSTFFRFAVRFLDFSTPNINSARVMDEIIPSPRCPEFVRPLAGPLLQKFIPAICLRADDHSIAKFLDGDFICIEPAFSRQPHSLAATIHEQFGNADKCLFRYVAPQVKIMVQGCNCMFRLLINIKWYITNIRRLMCRPQDDS